MLMHPLYLTVKKFRALREVAVSKCRDKRLHLRVHNSCTDMKCDSLVSHVYEQILAFFHHSGLSLE